METPEMLMKEGFEYLFKTMELFKKAAIEYDKRGMTERADTENSTNVRTASNFLANAYDEVSAIWENDISI